MGIYLSQGDHSRYIRAYYPTRLRVYSFRKMQILNKRIPPEFWGFPINLQRPYAPKSTRLPGRSTTAPTTSRLLHWHGTNAASWSSDLGQQSLTVIAYQIALRQSSMTMQLRRVSPTRLGLLNNLDDWPILVDLLLSMIKSISWHELLVTMITNYLLYDTYHWSILRTCQKCWVNITFKEEITEADADRWLHL